MNTLSSRNFQKGNPSFYSWLLALIMLLLAFPLYSQQAEMANKETGKKATRKVLQKNEDGTGAYATGRYRNLFAEQGHKKKAIQAKTDHAYKLLFMGDSTQTIYFQAGKNQDGPMAYVKDINNRDIRSEGMSYGMMIAVQMDKKAVFDALWNWAMTYMYVTDPAHPSEGYFSWSLKPDGTPNSETPAPDGEEYFVMSLYFASGRWGDGAGIYNYKAWADKILTTMRHHPEKAGKTKFGPRTVHAMVNEQHKMIRFVPDFRGEDFTDPSYHLPAFYELWARWGPQADREFWAAAADSSRAFFLKAAHPVTGLSSDYAHFDGRPVKIQWNRNASRFAYDSYRTASNWSVDWSWWRKNPQIQELSNLYQAFFVSQGLSKYGSNFEIDGTVTNPGRSVGLIATNAVVSLAATHPSSRDFTEALWNAPVPLRFGERYYDGLLYLMSLLHCSGQFRIWEPK